jgi:peptide chain release factor subunit 3
VELGRGIFETDRRKFTILDAPGPNMISGASQADIAVLVISARRGEFETGFEKGGQTREHAVLAKSSGIKKLVVAVNKMDDLTVEWSKERYDECITKLKPFLKNCGYNDRDIFFLPISGFNGSNLKDRVPKEFCSWYRYVFSVVYKQMIYINCFIVVLHF